MKLKRWEAVLVGEFSGTVTPVPFCRFHRRAKGEAWCERMNGVHLGGVRWELRQR